MKWAKVSVKLLRDPEVVRAGPEGALFFLAAILYCKEQEVDGVIPERACRALAAEHVDTAAALDACLREQLVVRREDGSVEIPGWLNWNDSVAEVGDRRDGWRVKKAGQRSRSPGDQPGDSPRDSPGESFARESESEDLSLNPHSPSGPGSEKTESDEGLNRLLDAMGEPPEGTAREKLRSFEAAGATDDDFADLCYALTIRDVKRPRPYVWKSLQERVDQRRGT